jgi:SAM-dependent methyltransferase
MKSKASTSAAKQNAARFNAGYYAKWYGEDEDRDDIAERAAKFVLSYVDHLDATVRTVLDVGCGLGLWKKALMKQNKTLRYTGVEFSAHMCAKYGWEQGDAATYTPGRTFDLVICQGVLQYLADADCERAIANLGRLSERFLYLEVLTAADAKQVCCPEGTDFDVHIREASWYATRLKKHFVNLGGGLYARPTMREHYFELWCAGA